MKISYARTSNSEDTQEQILEAHIQVWKTIPQGESLAVVDSKNTRLTWDFYMQLEKVKKDPTCRWSFEPLIVGSPEKKNQHIYPAYTIPYSTAERWIYAIQRKNIKTFEELFKDEVTAVYQGKYNETT